MRWPSRGRGRAGRGRRGDRRPRGRAASDPDAPNPFAALEAGLDAASEAAPEGADDTASEQARRREPPLGVDPVGVSADGPPDGEPRWDRTRDRIVAGEPRPKRFAPAAAYAPAARERRRRRAPRAGAAATRARSSTRGRAVRVLALSALFLFFLPAVPVALLRYVPPLGSAMMLKRWVDARAEDRVFSLDYHWVPASQLPRSLREAVVASEDQRFYDHAGFDWKELRNALDDWREGGGLRGASTITQQVAKNLFLWPGRSLLRKVFEAWFTVWIEWLWPKERILEVYLNIAEMGDGVFGAEAASRRHFRHPAAKLVPHESALLAAMLPSPLRSNPANPSAYLRERQRWILRQM